MLTLFKWMSSLSLYEGISYFALVLIILSAIPYSRLLIAFFKHLVYHRDLKIDFFEYSVSPQVLVGKDELGREIYVDNNNSGILIAGSTMTFVWQVEGAYRVDLIPLKKNISGNSANCLIDPARLEFILEAYGFFGKKCSSTILIPIEKIYHLDITSISSFHHLVRKNPIIHQEKLTTQLPLNMPLSKFSYANKFDWGGFSLYSIFNKAKYSNNIIAPDRKKRNLYEALDNAKHLKKYSFSTAKYNTLLVNHQSDNQNNANK